MSVSEEPANLADMVRARAIARGNAIAYEFEGRRTSFAEFDIKTNRVANALIALGVKPRERIAYLGKNSDIYFELLMGAMKANVVMAPVNWRLAGPEVAFIVGDCRAPVLFVGPEFIAQVRNLKAQLPDLRTVITTEGMSKRIKPGDEAGARTIAQNPMGRVGKMEELQNLAVFLISGGCDWINGETIAMDGGQALATGGNFYELRDWSDADWTKARDSIKAQNEKDRAARG